MTRILALCLPATPSLHLPSSEEVRGPRPLFKSFLLPTSVLSFPALGAVGSSACHPVHRARTQVASTGQGWGAKLGWEWAAREEKEVALRWSARLCIEASSSESVELELHWRCLL